MGRSNYQTIIQEKPLRSGSPDFLMQATKTLLRTRFGPEAIINRVGAIWMVHVDQPSVAEIQEREAELKHDLLESEDCACCDLMWSQAGDTVIFDGPMCLIEPAPWRKLFPDMGNLGQNLGTHDVIP